jgi:hypothetical protein
VRIGCNHIDFSHTRGICLIGLENTPTCRLGSYWPSILVHGIWGLIPQLIGTTLVASGQREWSRPLHGVTEEIMMLAEGMRPEVTVHIGLS